MEINRKVFGIHRPRIVYNQDTDKTHRSAVQARRSEAGTLMRATECGCPRGQNHCEHYGFMCEYNMISAMMIEKQKEWAAFLTSFTESTEEAETKWRKGAFFPRLKMGFDEDGNKIPVGFHLRTRMGLKKMRNLVS